ncbi:ABC transporter permease [Nocardiopsis composta]|uniref:Peptide/nickel transport system permease protein n=1 Tax=Nocardiopsis composta TaxID=157465 RepID=A0A7W8QS48_9ACTN|nr:ABC transporter permease [Nocardiopsis composta]MBB5435598.1 peptide/nickel transport system permease protein [Nocardiopsis composta]
MTSYLIRRCLQAVPLLLGISVIVFALLQMTPGGPMAAGEGAQSQASAEQIARLRGRYGLDDPLWMQYLKWLGGILTGDWGASFNTGRPVVEAITERLPTTLLLTGLSFGLSVLLALVVGVTAAVRHRTLFDYVSTGLAFAGLAMPSFWFGLMLLFVFSYSLDWLPSSGLADLRFRHEGFAAFLDRAEHLVLPVAVLSLVSVASLTRYVRSSMLDVLGQDYIRTARGNGLPERTVVLGHGLRNASIPVVTVAVLAIPELFLGAVITETIFGLPGMGRLFVESAELRDYPVLLGILLIASVLVVSANLLADILYGRLDPRISYE